MAEANDKDRVIKDAQYRKGLSIAFFNSVNAAIELTKGFKFANEEEQRKAITETRDWLLDEHKTYYASVIAPVGTNFKPENTLKKIAAVKSLDQLKSVWMSLSEDERRDPTIVDAKNKKKASYEKA